MSNLNVFIYVSVDGFFAGPHGEIDWFKSIEKDAEFDAFTHREADLHNRSAHPRWVPGEATSRRDNVATRCARRAGGAATARGHRAGPARGGAG